MNCDGDLEFEEVEGKGKGFVLFCFVFFAWTMSLFRSSRLVMV